MQPRHSPSSRSNAQRAAAVIAFLALLLSFPAHAQVAKVDEVMQLVKNTLTGISVVFFTVTFIWAGFKMAAQHAKWSEIAHIFYGGILAGGASGFAAALVG